jgi:phytoene dehydrogenase-like protein
MPALDVVIVGAGPNGLAAGIVLGRAGLNVAIFEARTSIGGGCRTEALTLPGYRHDVCAAIHPMALASPLFQRLDLPRHGVEWLPARYPLAHPLDDGRVAVLSRSLADTEASLGRDGEAWRKAVAPFLTRHTDFFANVLRPIRVPPDPLLMARFGLRGLQSSRRFERRFTDAPAQALFAGSAAHSMLPLSAPASASFGLVLAIAGHAFDWPCARGGSQSIVDALGALAIASGCTIHTDVTVRTLAALPPSRAVLLDVTPRQLLAIAGERLSSGYRRQLQRFRHGPGVFKIDYALSGPIPWRHGVCGQAATVHLGGTADEIADAEADVNRGVVAERPFVLLAQQSHVDASRAPVSRHTGWAYCHVPHGADVDMTDRIEQQIERFAPGFRDLVLARHTLSPRDIEARNANMVGGDIGGGANTLRQFLLRPTMRLNPYTTSNPTIFIGSSSTPPGGGVHGMCGYWAAATVLRRVFGLPVPAELA